MRPILFGGYMNAKMMITVPINSIPERIRDILSENSNVLNSLSEDLDYCSRDVAAKNDLLYQLEKLDEIRQKLSLVDLNIEDCYSTLKGYISFQYSMEKKEEKQINDATDEQG